MQRDELIKYLKSLPERTVIHVLVAKDDRFYGTVYKWEELSHDFIEFTDMRGNPFAKGMPYENDIDLYLGEE